MTAANRSHRAAASRSRRAAAGGPRRPRPAAPRGLRVAAAAALLALCAALPAALPTAPAAAQEAAAAPAFPTLEDLLDGAVPIPPERWQALSAGRTLWYFLPDGYWGREAYMGRGPDGRGTVVFEHRDGDCLEGAWSHDAMTGLYCFDFDDGRTHCFQHVEWEGRLFALSLGGDVQEVQRIDDAPLSCGPTPMS
ncbi:hypothetical protein ACQ5SO_15680 [Rhodovulum sp. DZ06]|uniref:hypothetical protein n=1 Tax=Rhodovulum sp. DZ06 TaxID=3425126 RepID=UPI003D3354FE